MWPFGANKLADRISDLENAVKQLKSDRKVIEEEWEQVYEKYRVAMSKLARRDMRAASEKPQDGPGLPIGNGDIPQRGGAADDLLMLRRAFGRR